MAFLINTPIKNKIMIIIFSVGAVSTITGSLLNYYYQVQQAKQQLVDNTLLVSKMMGEYCGLPLEFNYPDNATEVINKLGAIPGIQDGVLLDLKGEVFASYHLTGKEMPPIPNELRTIPYLAKGNYIHVLQPVVYKGKTYGKLYLRSFVDWEGILVSHMVKALSIIAFMLVIVLVLAQILHKSISSPIVRLTEQMATVARNKDYSVPFVAEGKDEIGSLYAGFNSMLNEINKREKELTISNESLSSSRERITKMLEKTPYPICTVSQGGAITFVNEKFVQLFGYTPEELPSISVWWSKAYPDLRHQSLERKRWENAVSDARGQKNDIASWESEIVCDNGQHRIVEIAGIILDDTVLATFIDLTERKKSEVALRASEEKYRTIFENVQDVFYQATFEGQIMDMSPSIQRLCGFSREEVIGMSVGNLYLNREDGRKMLQELLALGELTDRETQLADKWGMPVHVSINARLIYDGGMPSRMDGTIRDISERKKKDEVKEELRVATSRLALATNAAGIGIWEWDFGTDNVVWTEQMFLLFGIEDAHEAPNWRDYVLEEDLPDLIDHLETAIREDQELSTEFRVKTANGAIKYIQAIGHLYKPEGKHPHMLGVCWDISDRKRTEEKLLHSEANLYATINNTIFYIWSIDRNFRIINLNKPFRGFLRDQYSMEVQEGRLLEEMEQVEEFSPAWKTYYIRALSGESFELTDHRQGRYFKYALNPLIENANITGVSVFMEDITELKRKETALLEAQEKIGELKVAALRSAMNPHFVFNTLNSIQYFILKNDQLNAVNYLSTFSKLIRSILHNSMHSKIRLAEELEQLKNYVQLELLRFEGKFDFLLVLDEDLDVENIEVSSMIIQPYVENAILHGLNAKIGKGLLKISVKDEGSSLLFEIEDNGIGRKAASKHSFVNSLTHKSLGTSITEERLRLINKRNGATVEIEDLYTEGIATGTRVKVWLN